MSATPPLLPEDRDPTDPRFPLPPPPPLPEEKPSFWEKAKAKLTSFGKWCAKVIVSPGAAVVIVLVAVILVALGWKNLQIGGLLGKLFGKEKPKDKAIDIANTVSKDRVDANGKLIPIGEPDSQGMTQAEVVPIEEPGLFSNPDTVKFTAPGEAKATEIELPVGVTAKDVDKVIVVKPNQFVVTVKDSSGIKAATVDDLLKKYG